MSEDYIQPHIHAKLPHLATIDGATSTLYKASKPYKLYSHDIKSMLY